MALLAVDVTEHGVVMSADSQLVEIFAGDNRILAPPGARSRNPIVIRTGGGLVGLIGFAGTESIEGRPTAEWLTHFSASWPSDDVQAFCDRLAKTLSDVWRRERLRSVLEILVTGEVAGDVQFWFVRNSQGLREADWRHNQPSAVFVSENDLDDNYIAKHRALGESKDDVLRRVSFSFRQGVVLPAAPVFDGFSQILRTLYGGGVAGFMPLGSLDELGHFARVRMEFLKRLCTSKYGIYAESAPTPVGGVVHVYGVGRDGRIVSYPKGRGQVQSVRPARAGQGS